MMITETNLFPHVTITVSGIHPDMTCYMLQSLISDLLVVIVTHSLEFLNLGISAMENGKSNNTKSLHMHLASVVLVIYHQFCSFIAPFNLYSKAKESLLVFSCVAIILEHIYVYSFSTSVIYYSFLSFPGYPY